MFHDSMNRYYLYLHSIYVQLSIKLLGWSSGYFALYQTQRRFRGFGTAKTTNLGV